MLLTGALDGSDLSAHIRRLSRNFMNESGQKKAPI